MTFSEIISTLRFKNGSISKAFIRSSEDNEVAKVGQVKRLAEACENLENNPVDSRPYKVYTALLTQTGTSAPVATVLENTLNAPIVWTRASLGIYTGTLSGAFVDLKTFIPGFSNGENESTFSGHAILDASAVVGYVKIYRSGENTISITTTDEAGVLVEFNSILSGTSLPLEIRVYN